MKRLLNTSFFYTILALASGLFYREFTHAQHFTSWTPLSVMHTHSFALGTAVFLFLLILEKIFAILQNKKFRSFYYLYNFGLLTTLLMLGIRGVTDVLEIQLSSGMNAAISGTAGVAHIVLTLAIIQLFILLSDVVKNEHKQEEEYYENNH